MKRKKGLEGAVIACLTVALTGGLCAGCSLRKEEESRIFTINGCMTRYVPRDILEQVREEYPDMEIRMDMYGGGNFTLDVAERMEHHDVPDLFVTTRNDMEMDTFADNFLDLSSYDVLNKYITQAIDSMNMDGSVYFIPNFTSLLGIIYDKNLFEAHGWKEPHSYEELAELCRQTEKAGIEGAAAPWDEPGTCANILSCTMAADFMSGPEGTEWFYNFVRGKAKCEGVIEPYLDSYMQWYEDGIFDLEDSRGRTKLREAFLDGKIAMFFGLIGSLHQDETHDFGLIPFFKTGTDEAYYPTATAGYFALNKQLGEKGNEDKLEVGLRILELLSTPEGQKELMRGDACYSFLKGYQADLSGATAAYEDVVEQNRFAPMATDMNTMASTAVELKKMVQGEITREEYVKRCDQYKAEQVTEACAGEYLFTAKEDFTEEQTGQYFAAAMQDYTGAQLAMVSSLVNEKGEFSNPKTGVGERFYAGDIHSWSISRFVRQAMDGSSGWAKVYTAKISGETIYDLLENGICWEQNDIKDQNYYFYDKAGMTAPFYYQTSGLDAEYTADHQIASVRLEDGTPVKKDGLYTIAYLNENIPQRYLSDAAMVEEATIMEIAQAYGKTGKKGYRDSLPLERMADKVEKN